jgi:hypothetical protein
MARTIGVAGRGRQTRPGQVARPPSVRQVTGWICRHPDNFVNRDTEQLHKILNRRPELRSAVDLSAPSPA